MPQIQIDFDVFKALTARRSKEDETENDVLRALLKLHSASTSEGPLKNREAPWTLPSATFPAGTEFMHVHKGKTYHGTVANGMLRLDDGHSFSSPSQAAIHVTGSNANGWRFWKCKLPGTSNYVLMERLRDRAQ